MIYAIILAAGKGERLSYQKQYKQNILLEGKPIFLHTLEKFWLIRQIDQYIMVCHPDSLDANQKFCPPEYQKQTHFIRGAQSRHASLINALDFIQQHNGIHPEDIAITHDAVRPFVTHGIIEKNIQLAQQYGCVDTVIPATDTIVQSTDHQFLDQIPDRNTMYQGQTPQTFNIEKFIARLQEYPSALIPQLTDAISIFAYFHDQTALCWGNKFNMKITDLFDLQVAQFLLTHRE